MCCSSIGLAKAALESINGENLFGAQGASWSVIYVDIDAHNRNRTIFDTILPRESNSKVAETNSVACIGLICLLSQRCVCSCCYDLTTGSLLSLIWKTKSKMEGDLVTLSALFQVSVVTVIRKLYSTTYERNWTEVALTDFHVLVGKSKRETTEFMLLVGRQLIQHFWTDQSKRDYVRLEKWARSIKVILCSGE